MQKTQTARDWTSHPSYRHAPYKSTALRAPSKPLTPLPEGLSELTGPVYGHDAVMGLDSDMTKNAAMNGAPLGERIVVSGVVMGEDGKPLPNTLVEVWQANAAGRYVHTADQHDAPLDPNFLGGGRCVTDANGVYRFTSVKPGAYPWGNHHNAWRPAHVHFSLFGPSIATRLITQMYFPGDPLFEFDPILGGVPESSRDRLVSEFSLDLTEPGIALGYRFDIVLRGRNQTPFESAP
ncbi:MAG: protocatechuate 3,4-dioxygenase subunit beta [Alphaproteobacteria bacterium]|nr:protocatechuate 3,4-dioxygenase subunit beta [Alphaproteobacteria bacterium]